MSVPMPPEQMTYEGVSYVPLSELAASRREVAALRAFIRTEYMRKIEHATDAFYVCHLCSRSWDLDAAESHMPGCLAALVEGTTAAPVELDAMSAMKVWKLDDCDFVAAETLDEAIKWYEGYTGVKVDSDDASEASLETVMNTTEGPHDPDNERITFAEAIERERRLESGSFPCLLASTEI